MRCILYHVTYVTGIMKKRPLILLDSHLIIHCFSPYGMSSMSSRKRKVVLEQDTIMRTRVCYVRALFKTQPT